MIGTDQNDQWKGLHEYYNIESEKFEFLSKKMLKLNFDFCQSAEITLALSISVLQ